MNAAEIHDPNEYGFCTCPDCTARRVRLTREGKNRLRKYSIAGSLITYGFWTDTEGKRREDFPEEFGGQDEFEKLCHAINGQ